MGRSVLQFDVRYITNTGLVREHNEDSILIDEQLISSVSMDSAEKIVIDKDRVLFAVADGMGGHAKGEVASKFVLTKLKIKFKDIDSKESLKAVLEDISQDINNFANELIEYRNMGTVLAGVAILQDKILIFNVGDCRVYENSFGYANQLTKDHSLVYKLYEMGEISYEDIKSHPQKNKVTSAFVADGKQTSLDIYIKESNLNNTNLLICSDGVWEAITTNTLEECFGKEDTLECLKSAVLKAGANDNFSAIYIKIKVAK